MSRYFNISLLFLLSFSYTNEIQLIELTQGSNEVSFFVLPENPEFTEIFSPIFDNTISIAGEGFIVTPHPILEGIWIGSFPQYINPQTGFIIDMSSFSSFEIEGEYVNPLLTYQLHLGVNLISYPYSQPQMIGDAIPVEFINQIGSVFNLDQSAIPNHLSPTGWEGSLESIEMGNSYNIVIISEGEDFYWNNPISLGDFNSDLNIDVIDVVQLVNVILSGDSSDFQDWAGDIDSNGVLNILDVILLVDQILGTL